MRNIYTIGFTKKTAEEFFNQIGKNNIDIVVDIRLNNTSQLSAFSKYPDIEYFLKELLNVEYMHDVTFSPEETTLRKFKRKEINWDQYVIDFEATMIKRKIENYIKEHYDNSKTICFLCSENSPINCHRTLVSDWFTKQFEDLIIVHL